MGKNSTGSRIRIRKLCCQRAWATHIQVGDLKTLNTELDAHEKIFIQWGIFLILEKLKIITYR